MESFESDGTSSSSSSSYCSEAASDHGAHEFTVDGHNETGDQSIAPVASRHEAKSLTAAAQASAGSAAAPSNHAAKIAPASSHLLKHAIASDHAIVQSTQNNVSPRHTSQPQTLESTSLSVLIDSLSSRPTSRTGTGKTASKMNPKPKMTIKNQAKQANGLGGTGAVVSTPPKTAKQSPLQESGKIDLNATGASSASNSSSVMSAGAQSPLISPLQFNLSQWKEYAATKHSGMPLSMLYF